MAELMMKPGTKFQMAFDVSVGETPDFNMLATFKEAVDEAYFLISVPMFGGKPLMLDENQKFLLRHGEGENVFILAGYPEALEKVGIRSFWKMRQVAEQRTFFKRADERIKVALRASYFRDSAVCPDYVSDIASEAMTIDVSAGGVAIYLDDYPEVGETLQVQMPPIRIQGESHPLPEQLGVVCWVRQAPKGSLYRNICGLQFRYADDLEREAVKEYVSYVRAKYKI